MRKRLHNPQRFFCHVTDNRYPKATSPMTPKNTSQPALNSKFAASPSRRSCTGNDKREQLGPSLLELIFPGSSRLRFRNFVLSLNLPISKWIDPKASMFCDPVCPGKSIAVDLLTRYGICLNLHPAISRLVGGNLKPLCMASATKFGFGLVSEPA